MPAKNNSERPTAADVLSRYNDESLPEFCELLTDVNQVGTFGNRPLHLACYRGNIADVIALVEGGADVNASGDLGSNPLHEAVAQGHVDVIKYLLERGASPNLANEFGQTAVGLAVQNGREDIEKLLTK